MAFWDKAQSLLQKMTSKQDDGGQQMLSNRADGGFSGYQPKVTKKKSEPAAQPANDHPIHGFTNMMPGGVDPSMMQQFQQVGGQTGNLQQMPRQATQQMQMPQQFATGYQQPVNMPRQTPPQPMQQTAYQPAFRPAQQPQQPPQSSFTGYQPAFRPQQPKQAPVQPQQPPMQQIRQEGNISFMPGSYVDEGSVYKMIMRVAQITSIASCYRLIEFMQNNEAVIVNAEQITDVIEADRCMDLLFGAAYAMKQNFIRVSGKQIYLITPPQVQVQPFDSLRRMGEDDIERRWPGAEASSFRAPGRHAIGYQSRQDDFAGGFGQQAASYGVQPGAYTDYGGFGMRK